MGVAKLDATIGARLRELPTATNIINIGESNPKRFIARAIIK